jgi:hypothetical protein
MCHVYFPSPRQALLNAGFPEADIRKVMGGNVLRVGIAPHPRRRQFSRSTQGVDLLTRNQPTIRNHPVRTLGGGV